MDVEHLGPPPADGGAAPLAVVGGVHGDEVCGVRAVERLRTDPPTLRAPVAAVLANEEAIAAGSRFVEEDLNRAFPGDPGGDSHESRLAARLRDALADRLVLDLHATVSDGEPFALVANPTPRTVDLAAATGVAQVVDISHVAGGLVSGVEGVAVECGLKGSDEAVSTAHEVVGSFLANLGAVTDPAEVARPETDPTVYRVTGVEPGVGFEFVARNFERVERGEVFARRVAPEGEIQKKRAEEPFWPVLMSTDGYEDLVGFRAERLGTLREVGFGD